MIKSTKKISIAIICLASIVFFSSMASAGTPVPFDPTGAIEAVNMPNANPIYVVLAIVNISLSFLGIISLVLIIYSGFMWMLASGEEEKITKAKDILKGAAIGLVIVMASYGISSYVFNNLVSIMDIPAYTAPAADADDIP